ncbi:MAG: methyltransferase [Anaerolineae bacterium]|nr:methyltransferase [Anaerolineae bacterium]
MVVPPGWDIWLSKVPSLQRPGRPLLAGLLALTVCAAALLFFWLFDSLFPGAALLSQALAGLALWTLMGQVIVRRRELKQRYGDGAYERAVWRYGLTGLPLLPAMALHLLFVPGERVLPLAWAALPAAYLLISGAWLFGRALFTFGIDNLALVYVYWPEEGWLVRSRIYSVLRHPVYSSGVRMVLGLALLRGSVMTLLAGLVVPVGLTIWVRMLEEPELIERFGEMYRDYRRQVPAFFVRPRDYVRFWRFIVRGDK